MTKVLTNIKGLSKAKVVKIKETAQKICPETFMTARESLSLRKSVDQITTGDAAVRVSSTQKITKSHAGSANLDQLLGGGIETRSITEVLFLLTGAASSFI